KAAPRHGAWLGDQPPARRLLDVFDVRALADPEPDLWHKFRDDLAGLFAADRAEDAADGLIDRVSEALRVVSNPGARLYPVSIDLGSTATSPQTVLRVRSADTPGFLFAFAHALAGVSVNVERAEVRTVRGEAQDTFWVTDARGRPIVDEARLRELRVATTVIKQFTYLLPRSPHPGQALRQFDALISQMLT